MKPPGNLEVIAKAIMRHSFLKKKERKKKQTNINEKKNLLLLFCALIFTFLNLTWAYLSSYLSLSYTEKKKKKAAAALQQIALTHIRVNQPLAEVDTRAVKYCSNMILWFCLVLCAKEIIGLKASGSTAAAHY